MVVFLDLSIFWTTAPVLIYNFGQFFNPPKIFLWTTHQSIAVLPHDQLIFLIGATYDSIEGRFRVIKREAAILRAEIDKGERPEAPPRGGGGNKSAPASSTAASSFDAFAESTGDKVSTPRKPRTPKKAAIKNEDGTRVLTGRVKKTKATPQKPSGMVKEEALGEDNIFGVEHQTQEDIENDPLMEELGKVNFDNVLQYDGEMGIWAPRECDLLGYVLSLSSEEVKP